MWHGRRKGVVEFVDRTQTFAVNQNDAFLDTVKRDPHAYHTKIGENAMWMDNAFRSKMKVPFYGKQFVRDESVGSVGLSWTKIF